MMHYYQTAIANVLLENIKEHQEQDFSPTVSGFPYGREETGALWKVHRFMYLPARWDH